MGNFLCGLGSMTLVVSAMIGLGLVYIFRKDDAWKITKYLHSSLRPHRTPEWERYTTVNGMIMLLGGVGIALGLLYLILR